MLTHSVIVCFQWSFSADMLVLDPGESYEVSVFNIPKPELDHTSYDVSSKVVVPGELKSEFISVYLFGLFMLPKLFG